MKITIRDRMVITLVLFIRLLGYKFYIRKFVDSPCFNGNDVAIFKYENYNGKSRRVVALSGELNSLPRFYTLVGKWRG